MTDTTLPSFPVDDFTLDQVQHALDAAYDEEHRLTGADFTLTQLLDFLGGYDPASAQPTADPDVTVYDAPTYHEHDVIRALITEVRRLRDA